MAKVIKNPITVQIVREDDQLTVSLHYGLSAEEYPELAIRKGLPISVLTPAEQATAQQVMDWALGKIEEHEGIL